VNSRSGGVSDSRGGGQKREKQCATDPGMVDEEYRGLSRTTAVLPAGCRYLGKEYEPPLAVVQAGLNPIEVDTGKRTPGLF